MLRSKNLMTLGVAWILASMPGAAILGLAMQQKTHYSVLLVCRRDGRTRAAKVSIEEFGRLDCAITDQYIEALNGLSRQEYLRLRNTVKWTYIRTVAFNGGVTTGTEAVEVAPGVDVVRKYSK